ncbi:hypothetical protein BT96DRAFT_929334 [Gymnopus androsaceus JB14]|uniref:Uncharacterized protein n=1 Tax=Gymnopus androsaceus JB14 TaxID=1447944 RepID=A0A6A4GFW1_9AGAR|nr:hypothetical protein BT96DRAFT_929334 [Gymnopus androsaceus JB14]
MVTATRMTRTVHPYYTVTVRIPIIAQARKPKPELYNEFINMPPTHRTQKLAL